VKYWRRCCSRGRAVLGPAMLALTAVCACSSGDAPKSAGPARRDSVGIEIVENTAPLWAKGQAWTVADSPLVDIGGVAGDPAYDLAQVSGVVLLPSGRVVVGVGGAYQVRFYDAAGSHLATAGRRGNGPGEFQGIAGMWRTNGDSILISDVFLRRLTLLSDSGALGRTFSLGGVAGVTLPQGGRVNFGIPAGPLSDGRIMAFEQAYRLDNAVLGVYRDSANYILYSSAGTVVDTLGRFPGPEMEQVTMTFGDRSFNAPSPVPLGKTTVGTPAGGRFFVAMNEAWEIEVHSASGALQRIIRLAASPRPITAEDQAAHRRVTREAIEDQPMLRGMPPQIKQQMFDRVDKATYPKQFPFIVSITNATDGSIWVYEQATPGVEQRVYAVLDSTGSFLGRVTFPDRFQPTWITADRVAGIWKDADDVEHARVYSIRKP